jgi:hypothetical protein
MGICGMDPSGSGEGVVAGCYEPFASIKFKEFLA